MVRAIKHDLRQERPMRLIIHPGLHKTGSTYLQHILNDNSAALAARGVHYRQQSGYPAHHEAAWKILLGDPGPIVAMAEEARAADCHTVILSSEDLEGALHDERPLRAIDEACAIAEIEQVEWHVVLRDPEPVFQSLFAQLQHHVYADGFQLFYDVMHRGFVQMEQPMPERGTPYWYYCFDPARDLERLFDWNCDPVFAHDFAAGGPFPGSGILRSLGVLDAIGELPGPAARNARPARDDIIRGYVERVAEAVPDPEDQRRITEGFLACLESALENLPTYAELVGAKCRASHQQALARFGWTVPQGEGG
jgi:hypothetical protein